MTDITTPIAPVSYKSKDQELYEQWKATGSKQHLGQLVNQLSGIIYQEVNRQSGSLPKSALSAEAKKWTFKAIQSYDPSKGTQLSTHVMNYLPKVRRMNYKFQNAVRLPENLQLQYKDYNAAVQELSDQLNREPTDAEVAKKMGWSTGQTVKFRNSLYADLIESASDKPAQYTQFNESAILMEYLMGQLTHDEKFILDNVKEMSATELAAKLGVNLNRYNYLKKKLENKIRGIKHDIGM
ncbi:RNA polymerase sigma factor SigD [compost metagenome]